MVFSDIEGIYSYTYAAEKKVCSNRIHAFKRSTKIDIDLNLIRRIQDDCIACSQNTRTLNFKRDVTLEEVIEFLKESQDYQMKSPGITAFIDGRSRTLYMQVIQQTEKNLKRKLIGNLAKSYFSIAPT